MGKMADKLPYAKIALIAAVMLLGLSIVGSYNGLVQSQQLVQQKESQYGIALDLCSEKIAGIWTIFNRYVDHESDVFINTAKARSAFNDSIMQKSNPYDAAQSAGLIYANVRMVTESNPQLASALTAENSLASFQEAVNEIKTAADDWMVQVRKYNTQRNSFPDKIVGSWTGFPEEYPYYHPDRTKLNITDLMKI
ncbi:MAG TPA: LemA family protein [Methanothrix sp.]|nr:LemA family protein [Methanothrix sp.]